LKKKIGYKANNEEVPRLGNRMSTEQIEQKIQATNKAFSNSGSPAKRQKTPGQHEDLTVMHHQLSEIPRATLQNTIATVNQSFQDHHQLSSSAQPLESRLVASLKAS